jgi:hypothetical protein
MLYEMLTGRRPFRGDSVIAVVAQHVSDPPPPPTLFNPALPPEAAPLLLRALAKTPDERYQTAAQMASPVTRLLNRIERQRDREPLPVDQRQATPDGPESGRVATPPPPSPQAAGPAVPQSIVPVAPPAPGKRRRIAILASLALLVALGVVLFQFWGAGGRGGRLARLEDGAWEGGYRYADGQTYGGRTAVWIYGVPTSYSSMSATFDLASAPTCAAQLRIEGMDSEGRAKTLISVEINGAEIYRGPNPLPDDDLPLDTGTWATHAFDITEGLLRSGQNEVRILNLVEGEVGRPPFFMLDYAEVACAS